MQRRLIFLRTQTEPFEVMQDDRLQLVLESVIWNVVKEKAIALVDMYGYGFEGTVKHSDFGLE